MSATRLRRLPLFTLLLVVACPKKPPPKPPPPPPDPKEELKAKVTELYQALERQEPQALSEVLTADVTAYGPGPKDTYTQREAVIDALRTELIPFGLRGDVLKVASSSPKVQLAAGEQSGWIYDFPRVEQQRSEKGPRFWKARVTGHAVRDEGKWRFDAVHVSFGYPDAELYAPNAAKKLKGPESGGTFKSPDAEQLIGLTRRMLDDIAVKVERTGDGDDVVLIGTDPGDVYEGGAKFKALARPKLPELKKAVFTQKIEDGPRAVLAPDRKSGWVTAVVVLRLGKGAKAQVLPPFRALWIYAEQDKEVWNLVSEHQSVGVPPDLRKPSGPDDEPGPPDAGR